MWSHLFKKEKKEKSLQRRIKSRRMCPIVFREVSEVQGVSEMEDLAGM